MLLENLLSGFFSIIEQFDWQHTVSASIALFVLLDVVGSIPLFLSMQERGMMIRPFKVAFYTFLFMTVFLLVGKWILLLFNVDVSSFAAAGAIVVFIISVEMVFGIKVFSNEQACSESGSFFPVAFPLIAGPGTLTAILSMRATYEFVNIQIGIILNVIIIFITVRYMNVFQRVFGEAAISMMRKFFGIILMAMAVKLFTSNIASLVGTTIAK
ncbi:MAG: MarC family protein [Planctomycetaceae bacterium]|jgi:multiple antibiotic resistance protein|nr:MarC family protein [Planctomycetaceae bacterium]